MIKDKYFYWVEDLIDVRPPAYRILITNTYYDQSDILLPYDFEKPDGPIYYDGTVWYRNGNYNGELMIDSDLSLNICKELRFVGHRAGICAKNGGGCQDIDLSEYHAGPLFLAILIGRQIKMGRRTTAKLFLNKDRGNLELTIHIKAAINYLLSNIMGFMKEEEKVSGDIAASLLRAALSAYGEGNMEDVENILYLIGSKELLLRSSNNLLSEYFGIQINCESILFK
ncbi:MAG: hypothetical protein NTY36_16000 [Deltaproteobacteria bacterium]|nr:hypothetical protein [Deltaproteobacteria bacterium]